MRAAAVTQRVLLLTGRAGPHPPLRPIDWLRIGSLEGARALGMGDLIGSLEAGKEADMIVVDPSLTAPLPGEPELAEPEELMSRLIFRPHPDMVRGAWVRGRLLPS
jgi:5-methylthioadenosine/S-adenosylhomocysteine deaminase